MAYTPKILLESTQRWAMAGEAEAKVKLGLALSSGGARGAAHVGVLKVLERAGIEIAAIAGTSIGAGVGGLYAAGVPLREIEHLWLETDIVKVIKNYLPTFPRSGWSSGSEFRRSLQQLIGDIRIEDLRIPYAAVATDIETGEEVVLRSGPLVEAIRASTSIPGLFTPVYLEGRYLVDGGLVNPLPTDVVRAMGVDLVIAVDVVPYPQEGFRAGPPLLERLRNSFIFNNRFTQFFRERFQASEVPEYMRKIEQDRPEDLSSAPGVISILSQVSNIFQRQMADFHLREAPPDLLIEPRFAIPPKFHRAREAIEAGERAAEAALPKLEELLQRRS